MTPPVTAMLAVTAACACASSSAFQIPTSPLPRLATPVRQRSARQLHTTLVRMAVDDGEPPLPAGAATAAGDAIYGRRRRPTTPNANEPRHRRRHHRRPPPPTTTTHHTTTPTTNHGHRRHRPTISGTGRPWEAERVGCRGEGTLPEAQGGGELVKPHPEAGPVYDSLVLSHALHLVPGLQVSY